MWTWYNIPFVAALGCGLLCALLQLVGGFGDSAADLDGLGESPSDWLPEAALSSLGIGRVPLTFVLLALFGCFGLIGLLLNTLVLNTLGRYPGAALALVLLGSLLLAVLVTGRVSALSRAWPPTLALLSRSSSWSAGSAWSSARRSAQPMAGYSSVTATAQRIRSLPSPAPSDPSWSGARWRCSPTIVRAAVLLSSPGSHERQIEQSSSITALKSARQDSFGIDDVFGAQVARANAEVIQHALKQRNEIDQTTQTEIAKRNAMAEQERNDIDRQKQLEIARRNASTQQLQNDIERSSELEIATRNATVEQEKLNLERNLAQARATQQREILIRESLEKSAADQSTYEQQRAAELARVDKERAVSEAEKLKEQMVQLAEQRKQQAIQLAEQEREREVQRSVVIKQQSVEVADQERKVALAQQQAKLEAAEQERLAIAAQRETGEGGGAA